MSSVEECALYRHITALPPDLWSFARAVFEELTDNPFLPILSNDEIARLVCSPSFQKYLENEQMKQEQSLACAPLA